MVVRRIDFRNCEIFTSSRSLESIISSVSQIADKATFLKVLDAFCGAGLVGETISKYFDSIGQKYSMAFADDNDMILKNIACDGLKICADLRQKKPIGKFNLIIIRYGLHDLSYEDKLKAINALSQDLEAKGHMIISDIMPDKVIQKELTKHHQRKEELCHGRNKSVYLATSKEYNQMLSKMGIKSRITDVFLQEVYLRNWLGTLGINLQAIPKYENYTLSMHGTFKDRLQVFKHDVLGVKMYYPVGTIIGQKNG